MMEGKMNPTVLILLAIAAGLYFVLEHFIGVKIDQKEPPLISSTIPYVGHLIGIIRYGTKYYAKMRYGILGTSPRHSLN